MPGTEATFIAAASVSGTVRAITVATMAMPPVDAGNLDVLLSNSGTATVWLQFAANVPAGPNVPGCVSVLGTTQALLTTNAATLNALSDNPMVMTGPQALAAQTATALSAISASQPTTLTVTRGTATARTVFQG